jgi:hypothetical protein
VQERLEVISCEPPYVGLCFRETWAGNFGARAGWAWEAYNR